MRKFLLFLSLVLSLAVISCDFEDEDSGDDLSEYLKITQCRFSESSISINAGELKYVGFSITPQVMAEVLSVNYEVTGAKDVVSLSQESKSGLCITGLKGGSCVVVARCSIFTSYLMVNVAGPDSGVLPYIVTPFVVWEMTSGSRKSFSVSLYNGKEGDNQLFDFQSSDPDVISIEYSANTVVCSALKPGKSVITISHPSSEYSAQVMVYSTTGDEIPCYITTAQNVVQMALEEGTKNISVNLCGSRTEDNSLFTYRIVDGSDVFDLIYNNNIFSVTPLKGGTGLVEISHPESEIKLTVQIVVVKTSIDPYITSDSNFIVLEKGESTIVTCAVVGNAESGAGNGFSYTVSDERVIKVNQINNSFYIEALGDGSSKVIVRNKYCEYENEIYVVVNGVFSEIENCYITTSQPVVRMVRGEEKEIDVLLVGGTQGDENSFTWLVEDRDIVKLDTGHGNTVSSRSIMPSTSVMGKALITAGKIGMSYIEVSNPKSSTKAKILVKVYEKGTFGSNDYVKVSGEGFIACVRGEQVPYGIEVSSPLYSQVSWTSEPEGFAVITGDSENVVIEGKQAGSGIIRCNNESFIRPFSCVMVCADTPEELAQVNVLYCNDSYPEVYRGITSFFEIKTRLEVSDMDGFSVSVNDPTVCDVRMSQNVLIVNGLKAGDAEITVRHDECRNSLKVLLHVIDDITVDKPYYFDYDKFRGIVVGNTEEIEVIFKGGSDSDRGSIQWYLDEGEDVVSIVGNGERCHVKALKEGECYVYASHVKSSNVAKILVYTAYSQKELEEKVILRCDDTNFLSYVGNDLYVKVSVTEPDKNREKITWSSDDITVCSIDSNYEDAYIRCLNPGNTVITVSCGEAKVKIYVSVKETKEEFTRKDISVPLILEYLNGTSHTVEAAVTGLTDSEMSRIQWESSDPDFLTVKGNGNLCYFVITGHGTHVTEIMVRLPECGIERKIQVISADTLSELEEACVMNVSRSYYRINRDDEFELKLVFGTKKPSDEVISRIRWESGNSSVCEVIPNGSSCTVIGREEGFSVINVSCEGIANVLSVKVTVGNDEKTLSSYYISVPKKMYGILTGSTEEISAMLYDGNGNEISGGLSDFSYEVSDDSVIDVGQADNVFNVNALSKGSSYLKIRHPLAESVSILIYAADTEAELKNMYPLSSDKTHYLLDIGESVVLSVNTMDDSKSSLIKWTLTDTSMLSYQADSSKKSIVVKAKKGGVCSVIASHQDSPDDVVFTVSVNEYGSGEKVSMLTESIIHVMKGSTYVTEIQTNLSDDERGHLVWSTSDSSIAEVSGNGTRCTVSGKKKGICEITVKYSADIYRTLVCYVGESSGDINSSKCMNIDRRYTVIGVNESVTFTPFYAKTVADLSRTVVDDVYGNGICKVSAGDGRFTFKAEALGIGCYRFTNPGTDNNFEIFIEADHSNNGGNGSGTGSDSGTGGGSGNGTGGSQTVEKITGYLTTSKTAYVLDAEDKVTPCVLNVIPVGMDEENYADIIWKVDDEKICTVVGSGEKAKVYANGEGETVVRCFSVYAANILSFRIVVSSNPKGEIKPYLKSSVSVVELKEGESESVICEVVNAENYDVTKFSYSVKDLSVCDIERIGNVFKVKALRQGQTVLTLNYPGYTDVNVVVSVNGVAGNLVYLTTDSNYTIMTEKTSQTLRVELEGYEEINGNNFTWNVVSETPESEGKSVISLSGSGNSRLCSALNSGIAVIRVTHVKAKYSLELTVKVTDYADMNPVYIRTESNVVTLEEGSRVNVSVELVNGQESSLNLFQWSTKDDSIEVTGSGTQAVIRGLVGGRTGRISVTHPDAVGQILDIIVIVDRKAAEDELYITTDTTVIEMKPTDSYRQINVSLYGGTPQQNTLFSWEILNYSSIERNKDGTSKAVININGSQDNCIINAVNEGTAVIRVRNSATSHYLDIKVIVSLYKELKFEASNITMMEAESTAVAVNAPSGKLVVYESSNEDVCTVTGTNRVCMIDACGAGTAVVRGYTSDGSCEDEVIVKVTKNTLENPKYITVSHNVLTLNTLNDLKGITVTCKVNNVKDTANESSRVKWEFGSGTNNVVKFVNTDPLTVEGSSVLIVPVNGGQETVYLTWHDSDKDRDYSKTIYVQVEENDAVLTLNPEYVNFSRGERRTVSCTVSGVKDSDLSKVRWASNDTGVCRVMEGSETGTNCILNAVGNGETRISCTYDGKIVKYVTAVVQDNYSISLPMGTQTIAMGQESYVQVVVTPDEDSEYESGDIRVTSTSSTYLEVGTKLVKRGEGWYIPVKGTMIAGITTIICYYHDFSAKVNITTTDETVMKLLDYTETYSDGSTNTVISPSNIYCQADSSKLRAYYTVYPVGLKLDQTSKENVKIGDSSYFDYYYGDDYIKPASEQYLYDINFGEDERGRYFEIKPHSCFYGILKFGNNDNNLEFKFPICVTYRNFEPTVIFNEGTNSNRSNYDSENGVLNLASRYDVPEPTIFDLQKVTFSAGIGSYTKMKVRMKAVSYAVNKDFFRLKPGNEISIGELKEKINGTRIGVEYLDTITFLIEWPKYCGINGKYYFTVLVNNNRYR